MKISTVYNYIDAIAPFETQMSFDNAGLLVGDKNADFTSALLCLDITPATIQEAVERNCQLLISHHPVIFHAMKSCPSENPVYLLAQHGLTAICAHTNFDQVPGGVNDTLCAVLGVNCKNTVQASAEFRIGTLQNAMPARAFASVAAEKLNTCVRLTCPEKKVKTVAVCGGAGSDYFEIAAAYGADMLLTGEVHHHEYLQAEAMGFSLAAAGHFETENIAMPALAEKLRVMFPNNNFYISELKNPVATVV